MCSRFENKETGLSILEVLQKNLKGEFILEESEELKKTNIAPTNKIITLFSGEKVTKIKTSNWGIKFDEKSPLIFNSRIETIKDKPYWKRLFGTSRCLIPATAFYEWITKDAKKIPQRISIDKYNFFFIPSLFVKKNDLVMSSMITTEPNSFMKNIHNRMPVILKIKDSIDFLEANPEDAINMCIPFDDSEKMSASETEIKKE